MNRATERRVESPVALFLIRLIFLLDSFNPARISSHALT